MDYTINVSGRLIDLSHPQVMGILNVTPDSFYADSRKQTEEEIAKRAEQILEEGAAMIDVGAFSTRPGAAMLSEEEESARLHLALSVIRRNHPEAVLSIDTFRPTVAKRVVEEFGDCVINDVGGLTAGPDGALADDPIRREEMFRLVSSLRVPYIYMTTAATLREVLLDFAERVQQLRDLGQKDIILDPGFGFGKTTDQDYVLMASLEKLQVMQLPILVGISRKSMIWRQLGITPQEALNGTTALHAVALQKGASILRVHDVKAAVETVKLIQTLNFRSSNGHCT
ncbi:MAG: dihydropteroate synthase [Prevotella sp.]|nr:dihydropteroate synthase [Prevotella sp.]